MTLGLASIPLDGLLLDMPVMCEVTRRRGRVRMKGIDLDVEARTLVMARVIARMGIVSQVGYELLQGSRSQERLRLRIYVLIRTTDPVRMFGPARIGVL